MTTIKDFGENGELLQTRDVPLNMNNIEEYIKENGLEKTEGYLQGVRDILMQLEPFLWKPHGATFIPETPESIAKHTIAIYEENESFLIDAAFLVETITKSKKKRKKLSLGK